MPNLLANFKKAKTTEVTENDFVIFVVGPTGSGKTSFIKEFIKHGGVQVGKTAFQVTKASTEVQAIRCNFRSSPNSVVVVDTLPFHTAHEGFDAEGKMTAWIRSRLNKYCRRSVILFLHNLAWDPTHADMQMIRHLETFASTFPSEFTPPSRVYVLPTKVPACGLSHETVMLRLSQLESIMISLDDRKWDASMALEVFTGGPETAGSLVQQIFENMQARPDEIISPLGTGSKYDCPDSSPTVNNPAGPIPEQSRDEANNNQDQMIRSKRAALQFTPPGHPQRHSVLVNLGHLLYEQFRKNGMKGELDDVIALKRAALELIPLDAPVRIETLAQLKIHLSERFCEDGGLDDIIMLRRAALELTPPGHPDRLSALIDLVNLLVEQFRKEGMKADLDEIITLMRAAIELTPLGYQDGYATLTNIADFVCKLLIKGEWNVELDRIIAIRRNLLELTPPGHSQRRSALINLADPLFQRFKKQGMKSDLDLTMSLKRAALELTPLEDPDRYSALTDLADLLSQRFGKEAPLDEIVMLRRAALDLTPQGHSEYCSALVNLADILSQRFRKEGMKADLEETISLQQAASESMPVEAPERRSTLTQLSDHLYERFNREGAMSDLAEVIVLKRAVLELTPDPSDRCAALIDLIDRLSDNFRIAGRKEDLDEMISLQWAALELNPSGHPDYRPALNNLAGLLSQRFDREKMKSDLDLIISLKRTALELTLPEDPDRHSVVNHLVDLLLGRFKEHGVKEDLHEIITLTRTLLECTPSGDPRRRPILLKLASHLSERFKREGATADLTEIILTQRAALEITLAEHPDRCTSLANLADCLSERFKRGGDKVDLDEVITLRRAALECIPSGDARRLILVNLSDCTYQRFRREGSMADLTETIALQRAILEDTDSRHADRCSALFNCAASLSERFAKEGTKADLDEMIMLWRAALDEDNVAQDDPGRQPILAKLDDCLYERFRREGAVADLEEIIILRRAALERTPPPDQCRPLLNLASCLHEKFQTLGLETDIKEAIELGQRALDVCPPDHPNYAICQDRLTRYLAAKIRKHPNEVPAAITGISSSDCGHMTHLIRDIVFEMLADIPLRLLHTGTGVLCNRDAQLSYFEDSLQYRQLLSSISALDGQPRETQIRKAVSEFFQYVTLSHRWGSGEPLLRDIDGAKVYDLSGTDGLVKLQEFCVRALKHGFFWAWSDTCCIDKDSSAELQEAIGTMFSWYRRSSLTLVYLSDVSDPCSFANSVWFKRGWTLQELLASPTILFYTQDWSLCMNREVANHKTDPVMLAELQKATGIAEWHLKNFYPGIDNARSRLQWASSRRTTRPEDVAYSLFGIFKLHLPILYGEAAENALGRLLAEIISRSGDISVLDWVGEASSIHSCFPANLVPYQTSPCMPSTASDASRCDSLEPEKVRKLYSSLASLPRARFVNQRLTLPSIAYRVTTVKLLRTSSTSPSRYVYEIHTSHLQPIEVTLSVKLKKNSGEYILVRPWRPKSLEVPQVDSDIDTLWKLVQQFEQSFNALLLRRLPHNEYERITSDCAIIARVRDLDSILESETLIPEVV